MVKTIRYREEDGYGIRLGCVEESGVVHDITSVVPGWTDPIAAWQAFRALNMDVEAAFERLKRKAKQTDYHTIVDDGRLLPPVAAREVWAAGVTYERSRQARNVETKLSDSVYDRVYAADRPELFLKATADRLVPPEQPVGLRSDSRWMVPEPELALVVTAAGDVVGWTIGNDMSSRDIEGENPLYLPQAKVYQRSCSVGPALLWNTGQEQPETWKISLTITRGGRTVFAGDVNVSQLRRTAEELIQYLLFDNPVSDGTVLLTGTGIVPPDDFTLQIGDEIFISVPPIGTLRNPVR